MAEIVSPKLSESDLAANYGWSLTVLNSDPTLKDAFKKAVAGQWSVERFQATVMQTTWFRNQSESQRQYQILRATDPGKFVSQVNQTMAMLADQWGQLTGQTLSYNPATNSNGTIGDGSGFLWSVADTALKMGWNEAQINDHLASTFDWTTSIRSDTLGGSAAGTLANWRTQAAALGIKPTDTYFGQQMQRVALGTDTNEGVLAKLTNMSKQRYAAFADDIEAGATVEELTENYRQSIGNILEIPPAQVDVFDKNIQRAITRRNDRGEYEPQNIGDFEDSLRKDSRYQYTQGAHDSVIGTGMAALKAFGVVA